MSEPLDVLFLWHFHQPYYGTPDKEDFLLPWVRLHGIKAYYDMARHLEKTPEIKATFNFSGSLLRQLTEYVSQGRRDLWWRWSLLDPASMTTTEKEQLVHHFFSINHERFVYPNPRYRELLQQRIEEGVEGAAQSYEDQDFRDLQCLFNLSWCGHAARQDFPLIKELFGKERGYTRADIEGLLELHIEINSRVLPLYGDLVARDQIEITVTPMYHPIIPLLIDTDAAARATPQRPRPTPYQAPETAREQISLALDLAEELFGRRPAGMWPSEGSVSPEALQLFAEAGVQWIATDEEILQRSRGADYTRHLDLWRPWKLGAQENSPRIFFRDHGLSDLIGFVYAKNHPEEGADDLLRNLHNIAADTPRPAAVSVILDGENPWEHYDDDGYPFLEALYRGLKNSSSLRTSTPGRCNSQPSGELKSLHSGSWIMGNYQIWIGHKETNQAWEWVRRAHQALLEFEEESPDHPGIPKAREALFMAQGSDWFWWFGDDFSSEQDREFDELFRTLIRRVFTALELRPPVELRQPIHAGHLGKDEEESLRKEQLHLISPPIDGQGGHFFEWAGAGAIQIRGSHGSMYETFRPLESILYGFSTKALFLRFEPGVDADPSTHFRIHFPNRTLDLNHGNHAFEDPELCWAYERLPELKISLARLGLGAADDGVSFHLEVFRDGIKLQRFPQERDFFLALPPEDLQLKNWLV